MQERLEQRHQELEAEFEKGEKTLQDLEEQAAKVRQTLLRISGAIQVLEELLEDPDQSHENGSGSPPEAKANGTDETLKTAG